MQISTEVESCVIAACLVGFLGLEHDPLETHVRSGVSQTRVDHGICVGIELNKEQGASRCEYGAA